MKNKYPRISRLLMNKMNKDLSGFPSPLCQFFDSVLVPIGMPKIDPADTMSSVLDRVENVLRTHYLPVNYKGDL